MIVYYSNFCYILKFLYQIGRPGISCLVYLAPACLPRGLYILLLNFFFSSFVYQCLSVISECTCTRQIFTKFSGLADIRTQMNDLTLLDRSLKGRCYGNQFLRQIGEIYIPDLHSSHWHLPNEILFKMLEPYV